MARPCISATARDFKIIMSRVPCRTLVGSGAKRISYRLSIADLYAPSYRMSIGRCGRVRENSVRLQNQRDTVRPHYMEEFRVRETPKGSLSLGPHCQP